MLFVARQNRRLLRCAGLCRRHRRRRSSVPPGRPDHFQGQDRQDEVFNARSSFLFKHVRVVRMVDVKRNTLVYLVYSDKIIEGSPKKSVTAVPVPTNQAVPPCSSTAILC